MENSRRRSYEHTDKSQLLDYQYICNLGEYELSFSYFSEEHDCFILRDKDGRIVEMYRISDVWTRTKDALEEERKM